ncbi:MAG: UTRA domain-containing protein, partial [Erysipelotrichaceae bacterium]|nr:UTRA domain-containing protein [Erysipelotrichaceae bacterium]
LLHQMKKIDKLHTREQILIVEPDEEEKDLLKLEEDEEILLIKGVAYKDGDHPLEYYEISSDTNFYRYRSLSSFHG